MKPANITCCVCDHGLFLHVAQKLAECYVKVFYWMPSDKCMPRIGDAIVGDGFENVERVENIWDIYSKVDLWCFPDVGMAGLQKHLVREGKAVWGHRGGDELETNRGLLLKTLKKLDMEVPH